MPDNNGVEYTSPPQSRNEEILADTLNGVEYTDPAQSRNEALLKGLNMLIFTGGLTPNAINMKFLGAAGDGVTDDTDIIKNALRTADSTGQPLYFPRGVYLCRWQQMRLGTMSGKDIKIMGDGKFESIIRFEHTHNGGSYGNGLTLLNIPTEEIQEPPKPNVTISNIGFVYDNTDPDVVYPTGDNSLFTMQGVFNNVTLDNAYFHTQAVESTPAAESTAPEEERPPLRPKDTCFFPILGAKTVTITNCLFENFTNGEVGGCAWLMPDSGNTNYGGIEDVIVSNNEFRNTNKDEALAIYTSDSGTAQGLIKNVIVSNNVFVHKNWTGEDCYFTNGLLGVFYKNSSLPTQDGNILVSGNSFYSSKANQELIRSFGFRGVTISGNRLTVTGRSSASALRAILIGERGEGVVQGNALDYTKITVEVTISASVGGYAMWTGNTITSGGNIAVAPASGSSTLVFEKNTVKQGAGSNFIIRKNSASTVLCVYDNAVYGSVLFGGLKGANLFVKGNKFNALSSTPINVIPESSAGTSALDASMNEGITFTFRNDKITTPMASFKFVGKKSDIAFYIGGQLVEDSAETRAVFFTSADITYLGSE